MRWDIVVAIVGGILLAYAVLLLLLWAYARRHPETVGLRDALRLLPDLLRLVRRLASDREVPVSVRIVLVALIAYLALPFDLVPDFIPVLGYADDVIVVALVLRAVVRRSGIDAIRRHWPGTAAGLAVISAVAGVRG